MCLVDSHLFTYSAQNCYIFYHYSVLWQLTSRKMEPLSLGVIFTALLLVFKSLYRKIGDMLCSMCYSIFGDIIVPLILIFWYVDEKHFTYAGFDHFSILISFYQLCWSYVFLFVVWDLLGKELTHICLCVWVTMNQQNSGTTGLIGVRQAYGWRIS